MKIQERYQRAGDEFVRIEDAENFLVRINDAIRDILNLKER